MLQGFAGLRQHWSDRYGVGASWALSRGRCEQNVCLAWLVQKQRAHDLVEGAEQQPEVGNLAVLPPAVQRRLGLVVLGWMDQYRQLSSQFGAHPWLFAHPFASGHCPEGRGWHRYQQKRRRMCFAASPQLCASPDLALPVAGHFQRLN